MTFLIQICLIVLMPLTSWGQSAGLDEQPATTTCKLQDVEDLRAMVTLLNCQDAGVQECIDVNQTLPGPRSLPGAGAVAGPLNTLFHIPGALNDISARRKLTGLAPLIDPQDFLIRHLGKIRFLVGLSGLAVAAEAVASFTKTNEHCTDMAGGAVSGTPQVPDRVDPVSKKCTLDQRYSSIYLQKFLYKVDEKSQKDAIETNAQLCRQFKNLKKIFAEEIKRRAKLHEDIKLAKAPTCVGKDAHYSFQVDGQPYEVTATRDAVTGRVQGFSTWDPKKFVQRKYVFSESDGVNTRQDLVAVGHYLSEDHRNHCRTRACADALSTAPPPRTWERERGGFPDIKAYDIGLGLAASSGQCCAPTVNSGACFTQALGSRIPPRPFVSEAEPADAGR